MRRLASAFSVAVLAGAALVALACSDFRRTPIAGDDAGSGDAQVDGTAESGSDAGASPFSIVYEDDDAGALRAVWAASPSDVFAVGDDGMIREMVAGTWYTPIIGQGFDLTGVWGASASDVWAAGTLRNTDTGIILHRQNGMWVEFASVPHGLRTVWGVGDTRYATGNDGVIYSGPAAKPFSSGIQVPPNANVLATTFAPILYSIGGNSPSNVMVAADVDTTLYWDGTEWHDYEDPIDRTRTFRAIFGAPNAAPDAGPDLYEGANYYGLWHFTGAKNPVLQLNEERDSPQKFNRYIWSIWGVSSDRIVCVGDAGRIMTYAEAPMMQVSIVPAPNSKNLYGVFGTSWDDVWIVGDNALLMHGSLAL